MRNIILIFSLIGMTCMSYGKDMISIPDECRGNGCGSGWNESLVPERIGLFGVDFDKACEQHDICYSRCIESCKEKDGTDKCDDTPSKVTERKLSCDNTFEESMEKTCTSKTYWKKTACSTMALGYSIVVRVAGGGSFHGKEIEQLLQYLSTVEGRKFDFEKFEMDITKIKRQKGFKKNEKIRLNIENGEFKVFRDKNLDVVRYKDSKEIKLGDRTIDTMKIEKFQPRETLNRE